MTIPSWLAPNAEIAEPRVKKFAERISKYTDAEIIDFWPTEPTIHVVEDLEGNRWHEAWFCLQLKGEFAHFPMTEINTWRKTIQCWHVEYSEHHQCTNVLLSGRVLN